MIEYLVVSYITGLLLGCCAIIKDCYQEHKINNGTYNPTPDYFSFSLLITFSPIFVPIIAIVVIINFFRKIFKPNDNPPNIP